MGQVENKKKKLSVSQTDCPIKNTCTEIGWCDECPHDVKRYSVLTNRFGGAAYLGNLRGR